MNIEHRTMNSDILHYYTLLMCSLFTPPWSGFAPPLHRFGTGFSLRSCGLEGCDGLFFGYCVTKTLKGSVKTNKRNNINRQEFRPLFPFMPVLRLEVFPMPQLPLKPCAYPGCPELTRSRYCHKHKTLAGREYNRDQRSADHNKIYGRRWRTIRDLYITKHPLCEKCLESGRLVPVDEVHHILPVDQGGTHAEDNLVSLCRSCHTKTRRPPGG